ncbi:urease accessory protein [Nonomuraea sp. WAC 01424]|uniref:urease accessory protein UreD n=1 Tax=Nonomuraea sp. WAC 01424 TaxID=2203200 RepID=UPI000F77FFF7|nr:urease accessory protein UreD [Nonomuraea sp. WAC 01424]RSM96226.1 urease accessory protein [Nonomuraea sp. WAC 01424]
MTLAPQVVPGVPGAPVVPGVRATARVTATRAGGGTVLSVLAGDGPFDLRRIRSYGDQARVCVLGAMVAPLGGDRLRIEATAEPDAHLHVTTASVTIALRGPTTEPAAYDVHLTVGDRAGLHWLPQPLISAAGSNLRQTFTVDLAATARLVLREEQILGRTGEPPGRLATRLIVRRDGRLLLDQQTAYGPDAPGWDGPAILADHRATGQLLIVDPTLTHHPPALSPQPPLQARLFGGDPAEGLAVLTPLAGPAVLITAVAPDSLRLRRLLDAAHPVE